MLLLDLLLDPLDSFDLLPIHFESLPFELLEDVQWSTTRFHLHLYKARNDCGSIHI